MTYEQLYKDEYCIVSNHSAERGRVAIQVGNPPEDARPTIVDAVKLSEALESYLEDHHNK